MYVICESDSREAFLLKYQNNAKIACGTSCVLCLQLDPDLRKWSEKSISEGIF
jgi:hypothetical protein